MASIAVQENVEYKDLVNTKEAQLENAQRELGICSTRLAGADRQIAAKNGVIVEQAQTIQIKEEKIALALGKPATWWERFVPDVGAGGAAGIDVTGKPNVVMGITLSWKIRKLVTGK